MTAHDRGRLTIPDALFLVFGVGMMGALIPVFYDLLGQNAAELSTGEALLWQALPPALIVVMFALIYITAVGGGGAAS